MKQEKTRLSLTQIMIIVIQQSKINKKLSFDNHPPHHYTYMEEDLLEKILLEEDLQNELQILL